MATGTTTFEVSALAARSTVLPAVTQTNRRAPARPRRCRIDGNGDEPASFGFEPVQPVRAPSPQDAPARRCRRAPDDVCLSPADGLARVGMVGGASGYVAYAPALMRRPTVFKEVAMQLHMHSHHYVRRIPVWRAAVIGGCVAGAVFLVVQVVAAAIIGHDAWAPLRMIAAIYFGDDALAPSATVEVGTLLAALGVHFALSIVFALVLAVIIACFSLDSSIGMASVAGAVFGVLLYVVNYYGMTQLFPWFADARGWVSALDHIVFGLIVSDSYMRLERPARSGAA
ncbi:hypothetical protein [Burkholderia sp. BCC1988]|uniref:hypothetical protein n=1 Tax=Burkholderia sp. BCC1988 TaxID=2817443 RepID=UPI002AB054DE|nr:hypothetical protein [Burkholderia sp. BCC1988]